jgi:pyruvate/2-oxoglutarate dehydrogenase complex dihydrolipoamide dehydrogenase (E3) component
VPEVYSIGDCVKPRDAASATYDAARVAQKI